MSTKYPPSRFERLRSIREAGSIDAFLFTSAPAIKWLSGYFYNFEIGPSPFHLLPAGLLVVPEHPLCLVIADNEILTEPVSGYEMSVRPYASYVYEKPLDFSNQFLSTLNEEIVQNHLTCSRIGIEKDSLPLSIAQSFTSRYPKIEFIDVTLEISKLRMVKDPDEIYAISQAAHLCDIGQAAVLKHAREGMTELELFLFVRNEMEIAAGKRIPVMADMVCGSRTAEGGGNPSDKKIMHGELILSDLTPCLNGYWGDSCNTIVVGEPTISQRKTFTMVKEALDIAIDSVRPGIKAHEVDILMRKHIGTFPHHGGHGIGTMYHEEPRIVPYNETELLPGMVIALEPAVYHDGYGIRLEHIVVVTQTGSRILTGFSHKFEFI
jgi:Xaa-Pro dipeptidase